jgi:hypothetical protein
LQVTEAWYGQYKGETQDITTNPTVSGYSYKIFTLVANAQNPKHDTIHKIRDTLAPFWADKLDLDAREFATRGISGQMPVV